MGFINAHIFLKKSVRVSPVKTVMAAASIPLHAWSTPRRCFLQSHCSQADGAVDLRLNDAR